jgi:hypothetical protein
MFLQIIVALACLAAGLLQFAADRSPDTSSQSILKAARRVTAVGLLMAGAYILYCIVEFGYANSVLCWLMGVFALGQILFAMHTFFEPSCTDRLMARNYVKGRPSERSHA